MARRVITLLGRPVQNEDGVAGEAGIVPGMLVSGVTTILLNDADPNARTVALERDELGDDIDEPYGVGDVVKVGSFSPGQRFYGWLASGGNVAAGSYLEPGTNGLLVAASSGTIIGRALEAVNTDTAVSPVRDAAGNARIRVEVY